MYCSPNKDRISSWLQLLRLFWPRRFLQQLDTIEQDRLPDNDLLVAIECREARLPDRLFHTSQLRLILGSHKGACFNE